MMLAPAGSCDNSNGVSRGNICQKSNPVPPAYPAPRDTQPASNSTNATSNTNHNKIMYNRILVTIILSLLGLVCVFLLHTALYHISLVHPLTALQGILSTVFSVRVLLFKLPILCGCVVMAICSFASTYSVKPASPQCRLSSILSCFNMCHVKCHLVFAITTLVMSWCLISSSNHTLPTGTCANTDSDGVVSINEMTFFIMLCSMFTGVTYSLSYIHTHRSHLIFLYFNQAIYFEMKGYILQCCVSSLWQCLHVLPGFYVFYYVVCGGLVKQIIQSVSNYRFCSGDAELTTVTGLMDGSLVYHCLLTTTTITVILNISLKILHSVLTKHHDFVFKSDFKSTNDVSLIDSLSCDKNLLIKYLSNRCLSVLVKHRPMFRQHVYSLSHPGGHPHTWSKISDHCLSIIDKLTADIRNYNDYFITDVGTTNIDKSHYTLHNRRRSPMEGLNTPETCGTTLPPSHEGTALRDDRQQGYRGGYSTEGSCSTSTMVTKPPLRDPVPPTPSSSLPWSWRFYNRWYQLSIFLRSRQFITFFIDKGSYKESLTLFRDGQLCIWAMDTLTAIISHSYTEDRYGVVQTRLSVILQHLLDLHEAVDRHLKMTAALRPLTRRSSECVMYCDTMRNSVRLSLRAGLYKISSVFKRHLMSVALPSRYQTALLQLIPPSGEC